MKLRTHRPFLVHLLRLLSLQLVLAVSAAAQSPMNNTLAFGGHHSLYEAHKAIFWFLCLTFFILIGAVAVLTFNIIRRRRAEAHLRARDAQNRLLLEQADAVVWTVDNNLKFAYSRGAGLAKLGLAQDQIVGMELEELIHQGRGHDIAIISAKQALAGQSAVYEDELAGVVWETRIEPLRDTNGHIAGCVAVSLDITERKRNEDRLRASEMRFRNIVEASPMGMHIYEWTKEDRLVFVGANPAADRLLGVDHAQFIGKTIEEAFPALIHTEVPRRYREAARSGAIWRTEQIDYNEGAIQGAFEVAAFQTEPGKMAALFNDITDRKRTEMALKQSEKRFKTLIENSPDAFFVHDLQGRFQQVNETACQSLGYSQDELMRMSVFDIEQDVPRAASIELWRRIAEGAVISVEGYHRRKDGSRFPVEVRLSSVHIGEQTLVFGFARDITERRELELEKEKYRNQLIHAQKMEAIGTLAGGIAHDFNNLMMGIQGRASLMAADLERSHACFEHIPAIMEYTRSASELTQQLLGIARGGKYEVHPIDLNEVVLESAAMFGRTRKEIRIHSRLHEPAPVAAADRGQIEQVLLNLFVNAGQAMALGGELFLETDVTLLDDPFCNAHSVQPGPYARISVTDTGTGMDEATRHRIFDPFFTTKEKGRGTGLGLASAYGIIKNHAGIITVDSEPGHGATFNIYLPLTDQEAVRKPPEEERLVSGSESILLVDDERMILQVGQAMLERLGYQTIAAASGEKALEVLQQCADRIDLVILDIIMPGMDGSKTFDHIRRVVPQIPVILSSGYAMDGKASEIMAKGCNGFIQKPFSLPELSRKIRQILDRQI